MNLSALKKELDQDVAVCPHCQSRYRLIDGKWSTAIKRHGRLCNCPENWFCAICGELIETIEDFKEYERNGVHAACGEKETADPFRCETHEWVRLDNHPPFTGFCYKCGADTQDVKMGQKVSQSGGEMSHLHEAFEFVIRQARIIADDPEGSFVKTVAEAIERKCREAMDGGTTK